MDNPNIEQRTKEIEHRADAPKVQVQEQQIKVLCPKCNGTFTISKVCPKCNHCYVEECTYCGNCGTKLINLHL